VEPFKKDSWSLAELAGETGLTPRTIRYYISRGLVDGPAVAGRGAVYSAEHLERLQTIQKMQARGSMLAEIERTLAAERPGGQLAEPAAGSLYRLARDVMVWVRAGASPWRAKQVRTALEEFASRIGAQEEEEDAGGRDS